MKLLPKRGWQKKILTNKSEGMKHARNNTQKSSAAPIQAISGRNELKRLVHFPNLGPFSWPCQTGGRHMSVNWALVLCNMVGVRELLLKKLLKSSLKFVTKSPKF